MRHGEAGSAQLRSESALRILVQRYTTLISRQQQDKLFLGVTRARGWDAIPVVDLRLFFPITYHAPPRHPHVAAFSELKSQSEVRGRALAPSTPYRFWPSLHLCLLPICASAS